MKAPRITSILAVLILAGCGTQTSFTAAASGSRAASKDAEPSPSDASVALSGRIVFDRLAGDFGYESPSLGTFIQDLAVEPSSEEQLDIENTREGAQPTWAPDGDRLLVNIFDFPDIPQRPAIFHVATGELTVLEPQGVVGFLGCFDWSPDETSLACYLDDDEHPDTEGIYVLGTDGSGLTQVTVSPNPSVVGDAGSCGGNDFAPTFSPDGERIAFLRARCGSGPDPSSDQAASIWIVNRDGTDAAELLQERLANSHGFSRLDWSPDGAQIVYGGEAGGLYLLDAENGAPSQVSLSDIEGNQFAYSPTWSPDGESIAFSVAAEAGTDLYVIRPDGSGLTQITDALDAEVGVTWTR
jgi:Tol biopolymer transport system component